MPGMDVDEAFRVVGEFGPFQKRAVFVLSLTQVGIYPCGYWLGEMFRPWAPQLTWRVTTTRTHTHRYAGAGGVVSPFAV